MYNVRKKLWGLTFILFIVAAVMSRFLPTPSDSGSSVPGAQSAAPAGAEAVVPVMSSGTERFVAHRGYSGYAPENSAAAFEFAGKMGFWGIETDIAETSDGEFVCMHDETIDRTTNGEGTVGEHTLEELLSYEIDTGNYLKQTENRKIPTFDEYLDICKTYDCVAVVEIKTVVNHGALLEKIISHGLENQCVVTGPVEDLREIRARNSVIPIMNIGYYPEPYNEVLAQMAEFSGNKGVLYNYPQVDQNVVDELHEQNVYCAVWSIDDGETAQQYLDYGVDFVVTNELPARLNHMMVNENE